jgi:hypothetical protein
MMAWQKGPEGEGWGESLIKQTEAAGDACSAQIIQQLTMCLAELPSEVGQGKG